MMSENSIYSRLGSLRFQSLFNALRSVLVFTYPCTLYDEFFPRQEGKTLQLQITNATGLIKEE